MVSLVQQKRPITAHVGEPRVTVARVAEPKRQVSQSSAVGRVEAVELESRCYGR